MKTLWKKKLSAEKCKFKHATCHQRNKEGHIAPICKSSKKSQVLAVEEKLADSEETQSKNSMTTRICTTSKVDQKTIL